MFYCRWSIYQKGKGKKPSLLIIMSPQVAQICYFNCIFDLPGDIMQQNSEQKLIWLDALPQDKH